MAKVTLRPEILALSGKVGNMIFRTYKSGKVTAFKAPDYHRQTRVSEHEHHIRHLFALRCKRVAELVQQGMSRSEAWTIAKAEIQ